MEIYRGLTAFPGIAVGRIMYFHKAEQQIRQFTAENVKKELTTFDHALERAVQNYSRQWVTATAANTSSAKVLERRINLLKSDSFYKAIESIIVGEKMTAAYAVKSNHDSMERSFYTLSDQPIRILMDDMLAISETLLEYLGGYNVKFNLGMEPVILVTDSITTTDILGMERDKLLALVTLHGSETSHVSILAKTMDIPALVEIPVDSSFEGKSAIVDGYTGTLYVSPDPEVIAEYEHRRKADIKEKEELANLRDKENRTIDGTSIDIMANIGDLEDLRSVMYYNATGIGLLRSEFQYLGRDTYPTEEELYTEYKKLAVSMGNRLVIVRTADLGVDKRTSYLQLRDEVNPLMGNRGIRLSMDRDRMFRVQMKAIYRASLHGRLGVMFPMITSEKEMDIIDRITEEIKAEMDRKRIRYGKVYTGIMVETPAAVMISPELAKRVDFLSLGTNDLTQYTLAMDRQNPQLRYKYQDKHPAIMRMIKMVADAAHKEGKQVYICGELAADTSLTEEFLRMGVDCLSVVPACILPVRKAVREIDLSK